ncbi:MAG: glycosyltransferase, partial [Phycisphaerae bacterium]|nr:glycosyltransferase [Phycisphaerae bacterium]
REVYYHKHLMYNLGIALASGQIIVICDSDALAKPTFLASIIRSFEDDPNIVLHLDEVRNNSGRFYPFNYPHWDEITGEGATNWTGDKPFGIVDEQDPLHSRNYGACMAALRKDLIAIGGADEHIDYLGHICGPYEMTFRLVNTGKREIWHDSEWLYHVWHPGQAGDCNYAGPHDGKHMSSMALTARVTMRVRPFLENPVIERLRTGQVLTDEKILEKALQPEVIDRWRIGNLGKRHRRYDIGNRQVRLHEAPRYGCGPAYAPTYAPYYCSVGTRLKLYTLLHHLGIAKFLRAVMTKLMFRKNPPGWGPRAMLKKMFRPFGIIGGNSDMGKQHVLYCWESLCRCASRGFKEVALYDMGEIAKVLSVLSSSLPVEVKAVCPVDGETRKKLPGWCVIDETALVSESVPVVIATFQRREELKDKLISLGVERERIITLS